MPPQFFVVTSCFNADELLDFTIESVVAQRTKSTIHFHVQDAGSTDQSLSILQRWSSKAERGQLPSNIHFSYSSESDGGLYDGIDKAFERFSIQNEDWMTWINAGDFLFEDAVETISNIAHFEEVSWVSGRRNTFSDVPGEKSSKQVQITDIVRAGLYRGEFFPFIQQEGVFWRGWLWKQRPSLWKEFKLAGDYHLWVAFAHHASIWSVDKNLGAFRVHANQLSQTKGDQYLSECGQYPESNPERFLRNLLKRGPRHYEILGADTANPELCRSGPTWEWERAVENALNPMTAIRSGNLVIFDVAWQHPAITELHAYRTLACDNNVPDGCVYLAFPWATLIDCMQTKNYQQAEYLQRGLEACAALINREEYVVTVCQHILLVRYLRLLDVAFVDEVFWSHARRGATIPGYVISSFPLFPVQRANNADDERDILFSFVGAKGNEWYMTNVRSLIIDLLGDEPDGYVGSRADWHYQEVVYEAQINKKKPLTEVQQRDAEEGEFREVMARSVFSLCPSGSGPNSIRLWEAIWDGSIPVVLSDQWQPPGDQELWEAACVFVRESSESVKELPSLLRKLVSDPQKIEQKRSALNLLRMRYLDLSFAYDIELRLLELASTDWKGSRKSIKLQADQKGRAHALARYSRMHHRDNEDCHPVCEMVATFLSRETKSKYDNLKLLKCWRGDE